MFGLPSRIVIFDTEYTSWEGAQKNNWSVPGEYREIVQIGAVKIDTGNFQELDAFSIFAKPVKNPDLSDYFKKLTGITQTEVDSKGVSYDEALRSFNEWSEDLSLYSWGGDNREMIENARLAHVNFPFEVSRFGDIRKLFLKQGIPAKNYMSSTIPEYFGIKTGRRGHNALNDARSIVDGLKALAARGDKT